MKHFASPDYWKCYHSLPEAVRKVADKNFELLKSNPRHASLHLKKVDRLWSVRVGAHYRAVGVQSAKGITWFWIGTHAEYDKII